MVQEPASKEGKEFTGALQCLGILLVIHCLVSVSVVWAQSRQETYNRAVRGLATVDSLLALPEATQAIDRARSLWQMLGDDPVYGWQIEGRLGLALLMSGDPKAALPHLENVARQHPNEASHHRNLGTALLQLQRRGRALAEYQMAVDLAPGSSDLRRELGQLLLGFGDTAQAARELAVANQLCGGCPELDQPLASLYLTQRDFARAVPPLRRLYERHPEAKGRRTLVAALAQAGQDSSLLAFITALPPASRTDDEWRLMAESEGHLGGKAQSLQAVAALVAGAGAQIPVKAVASAPFWGQVALNLLVAEELEQGLAAADQAVALSPANVVYRNNRVVLLTRLGRDAEARQEWARVQALDPSLKQDQP